ncbi:O-acyltransferase like protein-like [Uranotaenia lowii]|uniref:O-acyltransferase like protein-like n=1 Tax=Uranotaenia lowii TaxID=190385 RepID=UPI00247A58C3|nr:O-acyltransferase like protein-like [Uranotaenia lowii]
MKLLLIILGITTGISALAYNRSAWPDLYQYDNYGQCQNHGRHFCLVKGLIHPDPSNELWLQIKNHSQDARHYRWYLLERGVCLEECLRQLEVDGDRPRDDPLPIRKEAIEADFLYLADAKYFPESKEIISKHHASISECLNRKLFRKYGMTAAWKIEYCQDFNRFTPTLESADYLSILLLVILCSLAIAGTVVDRRLQRKRAVEQPDKVVKGSPIASIFSIPQNLRILMEPPKSSLSRDFKFLEGMRFLSIICIIQLHSSITMMYIPVKNPSFNEDPLHSPIAAIIAALSPNVVQSFFTIAGILMAGTLLDHMEKQSQITWKLVADRILNRMKRIAPLYLYFALFSLTLNRLIRLGPLYDRSVNSECLKCRNSWWANVLFLNNYREVTENCFATSWYLSADLQFYVFGVISLTAMKKYPQCKKYWIGFMLLLNFVAPAAVMWIANLPPLLGPLTKSAVSLLADEKWIAQLYFPSYTSSAGYFYGILAGLIYHRFKSHPERLIGSQIFKAAKWGSVLLLLTCYGPSFLLFGQVTEVRWWMPIYGALSKNIWGFLCAVHFLDMALSKASSARSILEHRWLQPLGKLTYSVYLFHTVVIFQFMNMVQSPVSNDSSSAFYLMIGTLILSYLIGLVMFLLVEQPAANLFNGKNNYLGLMMQYASDAARQYSKIVNKKGN